MTALAHTFEANPHWLPRNPPNALDHIPGDDGWPLVGNTFKLLADPVAFARRMVATYGPVYRNKSFGGRGVQLVGPEANELVLFDREKIFSSEQGWGPVLNLLFPRGLMLMDFEKHRADRRTLSVAFKPEPMRLYADALNQGIAAQIGNWQGAISFYPKIKQLTLDLAATSFLGIPWGPDADRINTAFVDMVQASVGIVRRPLPGTAMGRGVAGRKFLVDYFTPMVPVRRASNGEDIFTQFCQAKDENGEYLPVDAIVDHMNFLMMAAHDTITSSLTSMVWLLAKNPEWQGKAREEMLAVSPAGEGIGHNALGDLVLTEMAFKESLRMIPPVPAIPRRALKDFEFGGYRIPAGTNVGINPSYTHMMEQYWPEPEKFDPMRFAPEAVRERHKYAWVPFGGGAHMCLGLHFAYMQAKIFLHHALTRYRITVADGYAPDWQMWPIPQPKDGLKVRFEPI
jgi:cytochrome P450